MTLLGVFALSGILIGIPSVPIYFVHKVKLGHIKVSVQGNDLEAFDWKSNRTARFTFQDIDHYVSVNYSMTDFHVVRIYFVGEKCVSVCNSMSNYDLLTHKLEQYHRKRNSEERDGGTGIENEF